MQAQYGAGSTVRYSGPIDCARQLIKEHGFRHGLMRGYWITVIREIPGYAGFYAGFEGMKRYLTPQGFDPRTYQHGLLSLMASGASGGVAYWFACYPLDMLKSKVRRHRERNEKDVCSHAQQLHEPITTYSQSCICFFFLCPFIHFLIDPTPAQPTQGRLLHSEERQGGL